LCYLQLTWPAHTGWLDADRPAADPRHSRCMAWQVYISLQQDIAATYATAEHWILDGHATRV